MNEAYLKAKKLGDKAVHRAILAGRYPYLPALETMVRGVNTCAVREIGISEIPLSMISGTRNADRQNAFAENFMPVLDSSSEFANKWSNLYESQLELGITDPIRVCEFMHRFYVVEGNKRVSVMKFVDAPTITADIRRILPQKSDDPDITAYYEFVDFHTVTGLYSIDLTRPGDYGRLAELTGHDLKTVWPEEDVHRLNMACLDLESKGGITKDRYPNLTIGDALMVYLAFYPIDSLIDEPKEVIRERVNGLRNELLTKQNADRLTLIEKADALPGPGRVPEILSKTPLPDVLKKTVLGKADFMQPVTAAFIYQDDPISSAWTNGHEIGRQSAQDHFGQKLVTLAYDHCADDRAFDAAVADAAAKGASCVFTTAPVLMPATLRASMRYPEISFLNCSINLQNNAVRTYDARSYEGKFLMGALAAVCAENHSIGYLAGAPVFGTNAGINAFAIGAAMVDPRACVKVKWSSAKDLADLKALKHWHDELVSEGIRIFSGPALGWPEGGAREFGLYRLVEEESAVSADEDGSDNPVRIEAAGQSFRIENLAMPVRDWGRYYIRILETVMDRTFFSKSLTKKDQAVNYWWGLESGVIDVLLSEKLPYYSRKLINTFKAALAAGALNPFDGELRSRNGLIKSEQTPRLDNHAIITMAWLNDNVIGEPPKIEELSEPAKELVKVSGTTDILKTASAVLKTSDKKDQV